MFFLKKLIKYLLVVLIKVKHRGKKIRFLTNSLLDNKTILEGYNSIGQNNILTNCYFGIGSYTGSDVKFNSVKIGKYCSIGSNVKNVFGNHPTDTFVSTHPAFFSKGKAAGFTFCSEDLFTEITYIYGKIITEIGNDVWIGDNVTILGNVRIGNGAIIGANALVLKDVPPYSINIGTPCKTLRYRFTNDEINKLQKIEWWNNDIEWVRRNKHMFSNIKYFFSQINVKNAT